ncbi:MAG: hypothetical protein ACQERZ_09290 [Fusobacteriota bacterium]
MKKLIEEKEFIAEGYKPIVDYEKWRVAILNYIDELEIENIEKFSRHDQTDEVFVLLKGKCILFLGDGDEELGNISAKDMKPRKIYNIKKGVWHTHTLSKDAMVLIVENKNTCDENSPDIFMSKKDRKKLRELKEKLWKESEK